MNALKCILLLGSISLFACNNATNRKAVSKDIEKNSSTPDNPKAKSDGPLGNPQFDQTMHDFGKITDGEIVQHKFKFHNTGKGDLSIVKVDAACGCTTPEWTKEIIPPGGVGEVLATFNSTGKGDKDGPRVEKSITVQFANSKIPEIQLQFISNIFSKEGNVDK